MLSRSVTRSRVGAAVGFVRGFATRKHEVVVVGGGTAGLAVASGVRAQGKDVAIVEPSDIHYYQPYWTIVGGGLGKVEDSARPTQSLIPSGATWEHTGVTSFQPEQNAVELVNGDKLEYEALVVATGITIDWNKNPGLKEALANDERVASVYSYNTSAKVFDQANKVKEGNAWFTFPTGPIKCPGAAQKIMYLLEEAWRANGVRDKLAVNFATPGPKMFAVDKYAKALAGVCTSRDINMNFGLGLKEIRSESSEIVFGTESGDRVEKYDFLHVAPTHKSHDFVAESPLANAAGFVDVDQYTLQHNKFPNVFGIGDCSSIPTSKTAAAIAAQSGIVQKNLRCFFNNVPLSEKYDGYTSCPLVTGANKLILAEFDFNAQPLETFFFDQAKESSYMLHLKKDFMPWLYWNGLVTGKWQGPHLVRKFTNPLNSQN